MKVYVLVAITVHPEFITDDIDYIESVHLSHESAYKVLENMCAEGQTITRRLVHRYDIADPKPPIYIVPRLYVDRINNDEWQILEYEAKD